MSTEKLSELSKPVAYTDADELRFHHATSDMWPVPLGFGKDVPLYSQEYVCALLAELDSWKRLAELRGENWEKDINNLLEARERIAELERNERHSERQNVIDGLARSGEAWADIEEYMEKWDEEHRKAIEEHSVRYQCREIGEGGWMDCDKARYDSCQRRPEMDTRIVTSPLAELEEKDDALRAIAFHVSAGGYNADSVDSEVFKQKIIDGINSISDVHIKRIAELEAVKADASQVFKEIGNELGCNPDNESIMTAIDELKKREKRVVALAGGNAELWETMAARLEEAEKRLATPVRLPDVLFIKVSGSAVPVMHAGRVKERLRAAGFTIEGDEP